MNHEVALLVLAYRANLRSLGPLIDIAANGTNPLHSNDLLVII